MSREPLHTLGAVTGLGWTTSLLGYVGQASGYGSALVLRFVGEPHTLLYTSLVLLLATLGLDKLAAAEWLDADTRTTSRRPDDIPAEQR